MAEYRINTFISSLLVSWVSVVSRNPWKTLILSFVFFIVTIFYISGHLGIVTDNAGMMSRDLHYLQVYDAYKKAFPHQNGTLIVVIDGKTPDLAIDARDLLFRKIKDGPQPFDFIYAPGSEDFFRRNGLLYLGVDELEKVSDNIARSAPLLSSLAERPDLKGLFDLLGDAIKAEDYGVSIDMDSAFMEFGKAVDGVNRGIFTPVSWMKLMGNSGSDFSGKRQFIMLQPHLDYSRVMPAGELMEYLRDSARQLGLTPENGVKVRLTGDIAMEYEELGSVTRGAEKAGILSFFMVAIVIFAGLGSIRFVFATLVTLMTGLVWTAGFAALSIGHLNMISVAFAVLFIGLGVDYAIHFCLHFREFLLEETGDKNMGDISGPQGRAIFYTAVSKTAAGIGLSLVICAVTTATGFFAFVPTSFTGVAELGLISGAGMFIGLFVTLTMLPAILALIPSMYKDRTGFFVNRCVHYISYFPVRYTRPVLAVTSIAVLIAVFLVKNVGFDDNPLNLRDQSCESVTTFRELLKGEDSPWTLNVLADSEKEADRIKRDLKGFPSVRDVLTIDSFVPEHQEEKLDIIDAVSFMAGDINFDPGHVSHIPPGVVMDSIESFYAELGEYISGHERNMPGAVVFHDALGVFLDNESGKKGAFSHLDLLRKSLLVSLPGRIEALKASMDASPFGLKDLPSDLRSMWVASDGRLRLEIRPSKDLNIKDNLRNFIRDVTSVAPDATGFPVHMTEGGKAVVASFEEAFALSFLFISIFLLIMMPSVKYAVLALIPLVISALFTGAVMDLVNLPLNFANIIGLPLILGIGVDNGIHMVYHFATTAKGRGKPFSMVTNRGIIFSGLTTVCSFGNLAVSPHNGMAGMGVILTVGVVCTLITTLFALPALLNFIYDG